MGKTYRRNGVDSTLCPQNLPLSFLAQSCTLSSSRPWALGLPVQGAATHTQEMAACLRFAAVFSRGQLEVALLHLIERWKDVRCRASPCSLVGRSSTGGWDRREGHRPLDHVLQFADVPRQLYWHSRAMGSGAIWLSPLPVSEAYFFQKCRANRGISSLRSLSRGRVIVTTLNR